MPCRTGTRESIDAGRRYHQEQRKLNATDPHRLLWRSLVERAHSQGRASLSHDERLYYALGLLDGEVHNGGFEQFFFNSSGEAFADAKEALLAIGANRCLELLLAAAAELFGASPVPYEVGERRRVLAELPADARTRTHALDAHFWSDPDELSVRVERFAKERSLVAGDA